MKGDAPTAEHVNTTMSNSISDGIQFSTIEQVRKAFDLRDSLRYFTNTPYMACIEGLLGQVYINRINQSELERFALPILVKVNPNSKLSAPIITAELIIDKKASASIDVLSMVSAGISNDELMELRVMTNATASVCQNDETWGNALNDWMDKPLSKAVLNDSSVRSISISTGVVQKYISAKYYKKFEAGIKGGAWGINVNGSLYMSTTQFQLIIIQGIDLVTLKTNAVSKGSSRYASSDIIVRDQQELAEVYSKFDRMISNTPEALTM